MITKSKEVIIEALCKSDYQKLSVSYNHARSLSVRDFFYGLKRKYEEGELYLKVLPALFCALSYEFEAKDLLKLLFSMNENAYHHLICELCSQYKDKLREILKSLHMKKVDDYVAEWLK